MVTGQSLHNVSHTITQLNVTVRVKIELYWYNPGVVNHELPVNVDTNRKGRNLVGKRLVIHEESGIYIHFAGIKLSYCEEDKMRSSSIHRSEFQTTVLLCAPIGSSHLQYDCFGSLQAEIDGTEFK